MKKWIFICLTTIFCAVLTLSAGAAQTDELPDGYFATAADLYGYWANDYPPQYPDYVGGVWTDNGTSYPLTFALTDDAAGKAGKKEILRLIADDASVKFATVEYSYNLLAQAMAEINPYFEQGLGLVSLGVYDMENYVGLEIHKDYRNNPATKEWIRQLKQRYGDAVYISYTDGYVLYTTDILGSEGVVNDGRPMAGERRAVILTLAVIGLLGGAAICLCARRKRVLAAQTCAGSVTVDTDGEMTLHGIEATIRQSEIDPPAELEDKILKKLDS